MCSTRGHEEAGLTGEVSLKDSSSNDHVPPPAVQHRLIPLAGPPALGISLTFACIPSSTKLSLAAARCLRSANVKPPTSRKEGCSEAQWRIRVSCGMKFEQ